MPNFTIRSVLKDYKDKNGKSTVLIDVWFKGKHHRKPLSIKVESEHFREGKVINLPEAPNLNSVITAEKSAINIDLLIKSDGLTADYIQERLGLKKQKIDVTDFYVFVEGRIETMRNTHSINTIKAYTSKLDNLKKYFRAGKFKDITSDWIAGYVKWLKEEESNDNNTIWDKENFIHGMLEAAIPRYISENPFCRVSRTKYVENIPHFLDEKQLKHMSDFVELLTDGKLKRSGVYFLTDCEIGIRMSDLLNFDPHKDIRDGKFIKKTQKGKTIVSIKVSDRLAQHLTYLKKSPLAMSKSTYARYLKSFSKMLGFDYLSPHTARHTLGYRLAKANVNIKIAQKILGHKQISSTEIYYHIVNSAVDDAIDAISIPVASE